VPLILPKANKFYSVLTVKSKSVPFISDLEKALPRNMVAFVPSGPPMRIAFVPSADPVPKAGTLKIKSLNSEHTHGISFFFQVIQV
jgi:hypothetical protein